MSGLSATLGVRSRSLIEIKIINYKIIVMQAKHGRGSSGGIKIPQFEDQGIKSPESFKSEEEDEDRSFEEDEEFEQMMAGAQAEEALELKIQNKKLQRKIEILEKWQRERSASSIEEMEAKLATLEQMLQSSQSANERLESKLKGEREDKEMLKIQMEALRRENESYKSEIDSAIQAKLALDDQNQKVQDLESGLEHERERYKKLKFNQQMLEKTNRKLKQQLGSTTSGASSAARFEDDDPEEQHSSLLKRQHTRSEFNEKELMKSQKENEKLKEALKQEQTERLDQAKDIMELETRLKIAIEQVEESERTRGMLTQEINRMERSLSLMGSKIKDSEEVAELCQKFLLQNGITVGSFMSEDMFQM